MFFLFSFLLNQACVLCDSCSREDCFSSPIEKDCFPSEECSRLRCRSVNRPRRNHKIIIERDEDCKRCFISFDQIEFAIRRNGHSDALHVKESMLKLGKEIDALLTASNGSLSKNIFEQRDVLAGSLASNIKDGVLEISSALQAEISEISREFENANSTAVSVAQSSYLALASSLGVSSVTDIPAVLADPLSSYNMQVSAIVSSVSMANNTTLVKLLNRLNRAIDAAIFQMRAESISGIKFDVDSWITRLLCLIKSNTDSNIRTIESTNKKNSEGLIESLHRRNLELFELVRFLIRRCRDEMHRRGRRSSCPPHDPLPLSMMMFSRLNNTNEEIIN